MSRDRGDDAKVREVAHSADGHLEQPKLRVVQLDVDSVVSADSSMS